MTAWFSRKKAEDEAKGRKGTVQIAEGLWIKCDSCKEIIYRAEVERGGKVCPKCRYPFRISARERIATLTDRRQLRGAPHEPDERRSRSGSRTRSAIAIA